MMKHKAILLLGPTGSGKTPLGNYLEKNGLWGQRCVHFDFGEHLRQVAAHGCNGLTEKDVAYVRNVITEGALLKNETFYIARTILQAFLKNQNMRPQDLVVLNGLPRHAGQARDMSELLDVILVVALECTPEIVYERIARNSGGDRTKRTDDSIAAIKRKLEIYAARTYPLLAYYQNEGKTCRYIPVDVETSPVEILNLLNLDNI